MESAVAASYTDASTLKISILTSGVFPYRILYQKGEGKMGVGLRWGLDTGEGVAFSDIPGSRLYTDAYMHDTDSEALTGSIAGKPQTSCMTENAKCLACVCTGPFQALNLSLLAPACDIRFLHIVSQKGRNESAPVEHLLPGSQSCHQFLRAMGL